MGILKCILHYPYPYIVPYTLYITMETTIENKIRKGTKVKIVSTTNKKFLNKVGIVFDKRIGWFGKTEYLIDVQFIEKPIWQSRYDLEVVKRAKK